jgi:serine protease Do
VRYAYAITAALLAGGATATLTLQQPLGAQVAQNAPGTIDAATPRPGAPMSFADLAAKLQPAVVNISTTQRIEVQQGGNPFAGTPFDEFFRRFGGGGGGGDSDGRPVTREATSLGSGFIISPDGYVVTNNHVISGGAGRGQGNAVVSEITVTLPDRKEYKATVVGRDLTSDLALLKIDARNLPFVQFGDSTRVRVGDWVVAIGNPFGLGGTVTAGIVSALHRNIGLGGAYDRYIQTDASINQGNSGGPMFDLQGNVIGINTAIFGIQPMTEDIATSLGLPKDRGEIVARVEPGEAAARAGIRQGDVIVKVDGKDVTPDNTLSYMIANSQIGSKVNIELIRDGRRQTVSAVVGERPPEEQLAGGGDNFDDDDGAAPGQQATPQNARALIGLGLTTVTPEIARQLGIPATTRGVAVTSVDQSSDAASQGLQSRDIILSINQRPVANVQEATTAVDAARKAGRKSVLLLVQRGPNPPRYVGVEIRSN